MLSIVSRRPTIRKPRAPFRYNLYVGYSPSDSGIASDLRRRLTPVFGAGCFFRNDPTATDAGNESTDARIRRGIRSSEKCLLYASPAYLDDDWFTTETTAALEKAGRRGKETLIVVVPPSRRSAAAAGLPDNLVGFSVRFDDPCKCGEGEVPEGSDDFWNRLLERIDEPLAPNVLVQMPEKISGYASAFSYYTGYLRFVLPEFQQKLDKICTGHPEMDSACPRKMFIICPESCYCPPTIDESGKIETVKNQYVLCTVHRAGAKNKDLKTPIFKVTDTTSENGSVYYFAGELATPLMTLHDIYKGGLSGMSEDDLFSKRNDFYLTLMGLFRHPNNVDNCRDRYRLLYWPDSESRNPNKKSLNEFMLAAIREDLALEEPTSLKVIDEPEMRVSDGAIPPRRAGDGMITAYNAIPVDVKGSNPGNVYDEASLERYAMVRKPRGICLVVSNFSFEKGLPMLRRPPLPSSSSPHPEGDVDATSLETVFRRLHFDVQRHNDLDATGLAVVLETVQCVDHSGYDAFVCCLLGHGRHGGLYTSDGEEAQISDILERFSPNGCPTLLNKPKLFFIQIVNPSAVRESNSDVTTQSPEFLDGVGAISLIQVNNCCRPATEDDENVKLDNPIPSQLAEEKTLTADADPIEGSAIPPPLPTRSKPGYLVPHHPDFFVSYSSIPVFAPRLSSYAGTPYVRALVANLKTTVEIGPAMKGVMEDVERDLDELGLSGRIKPPLYIPTGDKLLYF